MDTKNFRSFSKRIRYALSSIVVIVFSFSVTPAQAQWDSGSDSRYGIAVKVGYDAPVGNLSYSFKPAVTYGLTGLMYGGDWVSSLSLGYHVYKPKQDVFYYQVDESNYGTIKYKDFTVGSIYLGGAYNWKITDNFSVSPGVYLGFYFTRYVYDSVDYLVVESVDLGENQGYIAPKLGLTLSVSENISVGVEGKYNLFSPLDRKSYNDRVGTLYNSYAGNLVLTYNF